MMFMATGQRDVDYAMRRFLSQQISMILMEKSHTVSYSMQCSIEPCFCEKEGNLKVQKLPSVYLPFNLSI